MPVSFSPEQLHLLQSLQQNAQRNLPVIPNNGNPQGANNMPSAPTSAPPAVAPPPMWSQPSPGMEMIKQFLANYNPVMPPPRMGFGNEQPVPMPSPMPNKMIGGPTMGFNDGRMAPPIARGTLRNQVLQQELPPVPQRFNGMFNPYGNR